MDKATYILKSNAIFTSTSDAPVSGAVIVKDDKILDVVEGDNIDCYVGDKTIIHDYKDKLIMPGLIDAHIHFFMAAVTASDHMCTEIEHSTSEEGCIRIVKEYVKTHPEEEKIFGMGWYPANWNDAPLPTKESLDEAFPDKPVFLISGDAHTAWINTLAIKELGLTKDSHVDIGEIGKGSDGEPNGLLYEMEAVEYVIAKLFDMEKPKFKKVIKNFLDYITSLGITSVSEMTANEYTDHYHYCYEVMKEMEDEGDVSVRLHLYPHLEGYTEFSMTQKLKDEFHSDVFQIGGVKGFLDGVMTTYTGYLLEPYHDRPNTTGEGVPMVPFDEIVESVCAANAEGFPVRLHCIGDAAVRMALDLYEESNKRNPGHGLKNTIEHVECPHPDDIPRFKELDVIPSLQPWHLILERNEKYERLGMERSKFMWAHNTILKSGATMVFGTDYPVVDINPFPSIYAAVTRCDEEGHEWGNNPWEKISLADALICYTKNAADAYNRADELGTLEPGKLADIVVVDRNLFNVDESEIWQAKPEITMIGGKVVYEV